MKICSCLIRLFKALKRAGCFHVDVNLPPATCHFLECLEKQFALLFGGLRAVQPADRPHKCDGCNGSGIYYGAGAVVNGHFVGFKGQCFRCGGNGWQNDADRKRNAAYDRHRKYTF